MAAGDLTRGRRLSSLSDLEKPGDYQLNRKILWAILPNGDWVRLDERWAFEEHDDETVSIAPVSSGGAYSVKSDGQAGTWHGYLERGIWREV